MAADTLNNNSESDFIPLNEDDMDYLDAQKKIEMLEAYEYYLSESCPVSTMLNNAITEYPDLEPVFEMMLKGVLSELKKEWNRKDIMECVVRILRKELAADPAEPGNGFE